MKRFRFIVKENVITSHFTEVEVRANTKEDAVLYLEDVIVSNDKYISEKNSLLNIDDCKKCSEDPYLIFNVKKDRLPDKFEYCTINEEISYHNLKEVLKIKKNN